MTSESGAIRAFARSGVGGEPGVSPGRSGSDATQNEGNNNAAQSRNTAFHAHSASKRSTLAGQ